MLLIKEIEKNEGIFQFIKDTDLLKKINQNKEKNKINLENETLKRIGVNLFPDKEKREINVKPYENLEWWKWINLKRYKTNFIPVDSEHFSIWSLLNGNNKNIEETISKLKEIKNDVRILKSIKGNIPLNLLLSVGLFETDLINVKESGHDHSHEHQHQHEHVHSEEDNKIEDFLSVSFQTKEPFSLRKFQYFLDNQLKSDVFRAKGILWFSESERRHVFHLAGKRISIEDSEWGEDRNTQLVYIGKEIDKEKILSQLNTCIDT